MTKNITTNKIIGKEKGREISLLSLFEEAIRGMYYYVDDQDRIVQKETKIGIEKARKWFEYVIDDHRVNWLILTKRIRFIDDDQEDLAAQLNLSQEHQAELHNMLVEWLIKTGKLIPRNRLSGDAYYIFDPDEDGHNMPWLIYDKNELLFDSSADARAVLKVYKEFLGRTDAFLEKISAVEDRSRTESHFLGDDWTTYNLIRNLNNMRFGGKTEVRLPNGRLVDFEAVAKKIKSILESYGIKEEYKNSQCTIKFPEDLLKSLTAFLDRFLRSGSEDFESYFQEVPKEISGKMEKLFRAEGMHVLLSVKLLEGQHKLEQRKINIFLIAEAIEKLLYDEGLTSHILAIRKPENRRDAFRSMAVMALYYLEQYNAAIGKRMDYYKNTPTIIRLPIRC